MSLHCHHLLRDRVLMLRELYIGRGLLLPLALDFDPLLPVDHLVVEHPRHPGLVALGRVSVQDHLLVLQQRSPSIPPF